MTLERDLTDLRRRLDALAHSGAAGEVASGRLALRVPDVIEFCLSDDYLGLETLFPVQGLLLKLMFLQTELLTDWDMEALEYLSAGYQLPADPVAALGPNGKVHYEGGFGLTPDVLDRAEALRASGALWFRETVFVAGRRAGKGFLGGVSAAYRLWTLMLLDDGDPAHYFGLPDGKQMTVPVFAGNIDQARANQFADIRNLLVDARCFEPYIHEVRRNSISLTSPADLARGLGRATFVIEARESTALSGRGPASPMLLFDEIGHVDGSTSATSDLALFRSSTPAVDQFRSWGHVWLGSSPWQQTGVLYDRHRGALEIDPATGSATHPERLALQLPSWVPYLGWEEAHTIPVRPRSTDDAAVECYPEIRSAPQVFDEHLLAEQRDDPYTFAVEREAQWATSEAAFLNPVDIAEVFAPFNGEQLEWAARGDPRYHYFAHGDPALVRDNFVFLIAHAEGPDELGLRHVIVDAIRVWSPKDFPDHEIDYQYVLDEIWDLVVAFKPARVTFDHHNSAHIVQELRRLIGKRPLSRRVEVYAQQPSRRTNYNEALNFRTALRRGQVHSPPHDLLSDELRFLEVRGDRVDHPSSGPVQTNDVATALIAVVHALLGDSADYADQLSRPLSAATLRGPNNDAQQLFAHLQGRGSRPGAGTDPSRTSPDRRGRR